MKGKLLVILFISTLFYSCKTDKKEIKTEVKVIEVASIKGQQLTGVTTSDKRVFVNFPRWRKQVNYSVAEVTKNNEFIPYPTKEWNIWEVGEAVNDSVFVAVQSVVASNNKLYVVDTRNPLFSGVVEQPIIFVFDLKTNLLIEKYKLSNDTFHTNSYINDVRIDEKRNYAYFTDSGSPGLVVLNLKTGAAKRVLDKHSSTTNEVDFLTIDGKQWKNSVHSDGIAFDENTDMLYFHALTGYNLYAVSVDILINGSAEEIENAVQFIAKTAAPDGMIIHNNQLYYADLEQHKIMQMDLKTNESIVLVEGEKVKWVDTFSVEDDYLYYTNSRIHEAGENISELIFTVNKIDISKIEN